MPVRCYRPWSRKRDAVSIPQHPRSPPSTQKAEERTIAASISDCRLCCGRGAVGPGDRHDRRVFADYGQETAGEMKLTRARCEVMLSF
jgi:hypothetical protein